jgi:hypothetical protein
MSRPAGVSDCYNSFMKKSDSHSPTPYSPVPAGSHPSTPCLTVAEAVAYCALKGLFRTPKTVRKWAMRSAKDPENAELSVRREDIENGFRWTIEQTSLDRKIEQELEFEARSNRSEQVGASANASSKAQRPDGLANLLDEHLQPRGELVATGSHQLGTVQEVSGLVHELRDRIDDLKRQVEFYEEELRDRRQSKLALTDVIKAFRLNAENQAGRERERRENPFSHSDPVPRGDNPTGNAAEGMLQ